MEPIPVKSIPLSEFGYKCFFEDSPLEVTSKITAFSSEHAAPVIRKASGFRRADRRACNTDSFHIVSHCLFSYPNARANLDEWFEALPFTREETIFVIYPCDNVLLTSWDNFVSAWDTFWEPFYAVDVCDMTFNRALVLGPEEIGYYVERL